MSKKIIASVIFLVGLGIFFLGMLQTNLACNKEQNLCSLASSIPALHLTLDKITFKFSDIKYITCERRVQAARGSGKRAYYELTLEVNKEPYVIESCPNRRICRRHADRLLDMKAFPQYKTIEFKSSIGVSNVMGIILGAALLILGGKMFFDKPAEEELDEEENSQE